MHSTTPAVATTNPRPPSYARARLRLGQTGVGLMTLLAVLVLADDTLLQQLAGAGGPAGLMRLLALQALLQLPLDVLGGWWLPRRHGRSAPSLPTALLGGLRGVLVQTAVMLTAGLVLIAVGRAAGTPAALGAAAVSMLLLIAAQRHVLRWTGGFTEREQASARIHETLREALGRERPCEVWRGRDPGFTGGWFGLPGREVLVLPRLWVEQLGPDQLRAAVMRRALVLRSGARSRGLLLGGATVLGGLALASCWPGAGFSGVVELMVTAAGLTVFGFLGLLVLPTPSRSAVFAVDAAAVRSGVPRGVLSGLIRRLDRWQDDEPARTPAVEAVFHPIPSVRRREQALDAAEAGGPGAWHAARTMLFLSWIGLGWLSRTVHCNSGRPELWAALPAD